MAGPGRRPLRSLDGPDRRCLNPGGPPPFRSCTLHRAGARALQYIYICCSFRERRLEFLAPRVSSACTARLQCSAPMATANRVSLSIELHDSFTACSGDEGARTRSRSVSYFGRALCSEFFSLAESAADCRRGGHQMGEYANGQGTVAGKIRPGRII
jgi:hypothetical protein